ncbi:hypothetical protein [Rhodococcus koreensis]
MNEVYRSQVTAPTRLRDAVTDPGRPDSRAATAAPRLPGGPSGGLAPGIGSVVVALIRPGRTVTPESGDRSSELAAGQ